LELIFNEWFVEYIAPGSGDEQLVAAILDVLEARGEVLFVRRKSPWVDKLYRYANQSARERRRLVRRFFLLMRNPAVVRLVDEEEIGNLPALLEEVTPRKDRYLVELAAVSRDRTIVTTDSALRAAVDGNCGIRVLLLEEFLEEYGLHRIG